MPRVHRRVGRGLRGEQAEDAEVDGDGQVIGPGRRARHGQQLPGVRVHHPHEVAAPMGKGLLLSFLIGGIPYIM